MGKGAQQLGDFANAIGGSLGGTGSYFGGTPGGAGGWGQVASDLTGDVGSLWKSLSSSPQQGGGFSTLGNILQNVGPLAALSTSIPLASDQYSLYNRLRNAKYGQLPPGVAENISRTVEGQAGSAYGSAVPGLVTQNLANMDASAIAQLQYPYLASLGQAAQMGQQPGSLEHIIAAITGGLGQNYASSTGTPQNPTPLTSDQASQLPWYIPASNVIGTY